MPSSCPYNCRRLQANQKLQQLAAGKLPELAAAADGDRSPSPEPVYNEFGARINTREARTREKLQRRRNQLIGDLIKTSPNYRPPADYKPEKKTR